MFDPMVLAQLTGAMQTNPDMFAQWMAQMGVQPPPLGALDQVAASPGGATGPAIGQGPPPVLGMPPGAPTPVGMMAPPAGGAPSLGQSLSPLGMAAKGIGGSSDQKPVFSGGVSGSQKAPDMAIGKAGVSSQQQALMQLLARMQGGGGPPPLGLSLGR